MKFTEEQLLIVRSLTDRKKRIDAYLKNARDIIQKNIDNYVEAMDMSDDLDRELLALIHEWFPSLKGHSFSLHKETLELRDEGLPIEDPEISKMLDAVMSDPSFGTKV